MKMKDLVIKELYYLHHHTKNSANKSTSRDWTLRSLTVEDRNEYKTAKRKDRARHRLLLSELCKDAGQLVLDLNVLFELKSPHLKIAKHRRDTMQTNYFKLMHNNQTPATAPLRSPASAPALHSIGMASSLKHRRQSFKHSKKKRRLSGMSNSMATMLTRHSRRKATIEQEMQDLLAQGHNEVVRLHSLHEKECAIIRKAVLRNEVHDRIYLCVKVRQSSKWALRYYRINHAMVFLNLLTLFLETMQVFQVYGEESQACKRVVQYHCARIVHRYCGGRNRAGPKDLPSCQAARAANVGCFSNASMHYTGCMGSKINNCDFPPTNMTCTPTTTGTTSGATGNISGTSPYSPRVAHTAPFDVPWLHNPHKVCGFDYSTKSDCNGAVKCKWNDYKAKCVKKGGSIQSTYVSKHAINICGRIQCKLNSQVTANLRLSPWFFYQLFYVLEVLFMCWFVFDLVLNVIVHQNEHEQGYLWWIETQTTTATEEDGASDDNDTAAAAAAAAAVVALPDEEDATGGAIDTSGEPVKKCKCDLDNIVCTVTTVMQTVEIIYCTFVVFGEPTPKYTVYQNIWGGDPFDIRILRIAIPLRFAIMQKDVFRILSSTAARVFHKLIVPYLFFFVIAMIFATMFYVVESGDLFIDCELNQFAPKYPGILRCCCVVVVVVVDRVFTLFYTFHCSHTQPQQKRFWKFNPVAVGVLYLLHNQMRKM